MAYNLVSSQPVHSTILTHLPNKHQRVIFLICFHQILITISKVPQVPETMVAILSSDEGEQVFLVFRKLLINCIQLVSRIAMDNDNLQYALNERRVSWLISFKLMASC